jgi:hypothetical protein
MGATDSNIVQFRSKIAAANSTVQLMGSYRPTDFSESDSNVTQPKQPQGDHMSDTPISKDWAERQLSDLNHKIDSHRKDWEAEIKDMNRKFDHKFELLVADSNAKFDKMFLELKSASERNDLRIDAKFAQTDAVIARVETNITRWLVGIIFAIVGLAFSFWRMTYDGGHPKADPPVIVEKAISPAPIPSAEAPTKAPEPPSDAPAITAEPPAAKPIQKK